MRYWLVLAATLIGLALPSWSFGQGFLVDLGDQPRFRLPRPHIWPPEPIPPPHPHPLPHPQPAYRVKDLSLQVTLSEGVARAQVTQTFANSGSVPLEACFVFPLPHDGAVESMTFMVDGKEIEAKVLDAREARQIYEGYVRRNQDPALVEWLGCGMIRTSVFPLPPGGERQVMLRYSQVCRRHHGVTDFLFPLSTAKYSSHPVDKVAVRVAIQETTPIKNVYSPTHPIEIKRPAERQAVVSWEKSHEIPTSDFRLFYDVGDQAFLANLLSYRPDATEDGYFMLLASPEIKRDSEAVIKKSIVFAVDRSGSMSGKKIEQARNALKFVLNNLREGDLFNIVAYDSQVESFRPEMQRFNEENRVSALGFVEGLYAGGSTNIEGALQTALAQLTDDTRPNYVLFLTDGLPTAGVTNEAQIVESSKTYNKVRARVISLGVGYDVNSRLLDKLARAGQGRSEYVRPNEDIEASVSRLYNRIGAPAMTDVQVKFDLEDLPAEKGEAVNRIYPRQTLDLFAGDQLVLIGRYKAGGEAKIRLSGKVDGKEQKLDFPGKFTNHSPDSSLQFIAKLWAFRRIGEIIDEIDLKGPNQELTDEMISLAKKYGILTPYTSFLADENVGLRDTAGHRSRATDHLSQLQVESGALGFEQRRAKGFYQFAERLPEGAGGYGGSPFDADAFRAMPGAAGPAPAAAGFAGRAASRAPTTLAPNAPDAPRGAAAPPARPQPTVQSVGAKTFFFREGRWVDSELSAEQEEKVEKIERYGKAYFELVDRFGKDVAPYLAIEGDVIVVLDGQAYAF